MNEQYLIIWGVRVSGYIQYTGTELLEGKSLDNAFNNRYLDNPPQGTAVVMEAYKLEQGIDADSSEPHTILRRLI